MNENSKKVDALLLTETNFILDITFEQSEQCERLFSLALNSGVPVVIPEYSFAEAEGNIGNTIQKRLSAIDSAISVLKQSARSAYRDVTTLIDQLQQFKESSEAEELPALHARSNRRLAHSLGLRQEWKNFLKALALFLFRQKSLRVQN